MRTGLSLLFILSYVAAFAQKDIYLKSVPHKVYGHDLVLLEPKDTAFISFSRITSYDMGMYPHVSYFFNGDLQDGTYRVFIDNTLQESRTFRNGDKDSIWMNLRRDKSISLETYQKGRKNGMQAEYDSTGHLAHFSWSNEGYEPVTTDYYPSGKVRQHYYNIGFVELYQSFDEEGHIGTLSQKTFNNCEHDMLDIVAHYENGRLNGVSRIELYPNLFEIEYRDNEIIWWKHMQYRYPEKGDSTQRVRTISYEADSTVAKSININLTGKYPQ